MNATCTLRLNIIPKKKATVIFLRHFKVLGIHFTIIRLSIFTNILHNIITNIF